MLGSKVVSSRAFNLVKNSTSVIIVGSVSPFLTLPDVAYFLRVFSFPLVYFSNSGQMRDGPYWISRDKSLVKLIDLSDNTNIGRLVQFYKKHS